MDMRADVGGGMCMDMFADVGGGMCRDARPGICIDMCGGMCVGLCGGLCRHMCRDMCRDMCGDMCGNMCIGGISRDMCIDTPVSSLARIITNMLTSLTHLSRRWPG